MFPGHIIRQYTIVSYAFGSSNVRTDGLVNSLRSHVTILRLALNFPRYIYAQPLATCTIA